MFENVGRKIKGFVKIIFWIEAIASVVAGIVYMATAWDTQWIGLFIAAGGILVAWISSWMLYGYGEIIDKLIEIERNTRGSGKKSETQEKIDSERLGNLERLRAQGLITEEEYQQAASKEQ